MVSNKCVKWWGGGVCVWVLTERAVPRPFDVCLAVVPGKPTTEQTCERAMRREKARESGTRRERERGDMEC